MKGERAEMPKMKTHSATKKRFRLTGGGKVVYQKSGRRHLTGLKGATHPASVSRSSDGDLTRMGQTLLPYA